MSIQEKVKVAVVVAVKVINIKKIGSLIFFNGRNYTWYQQQQS